MQRLLPKLREPSELTIFHHPLVATPGGVDQHVQSAGNASECSRGLLVAKVIARNPHDRVRKIACRYSPARGEYIESGLRESDGGSPADSAACAGDQGGWHLPTLAEKRYPKKRSKSARVSERMRFKSDSGIGVQRGSSALRASSCTSEPGNLLSAWPVMTRRP